MRWLPALLALLLLSPLAPADMVMEIVPLRHRLVGDLLPTLRELVEPGGTVTGLNDQIVIRTTPANLAELKQVVASLDRRARQLRITVRQDIGQQNQWRDDALSARLRTGHLAGTIGTAPPHAAPGVGLAIGDDDSHLAYRNYSTQGTEDSANTHFVTAIEGTPAYINAGQLIPLPRQSAVLTPYGAAIQESLDYEPVGAGFYVTPRLAGDQVNLEISPYADKMSANGGGIIDSHGMATTASGRLGEWIPLGGASASFSDQAQETSSSTRRQGSDVYDVWVKVEVLP